MSAGGDSPRTDSIGEDYDRRAREAARLSEQLAAALARSAPPSEIAKLRRALDEARYVGD